MPIRELEKSRDSKQKEPYLSSDGNEGGHVEVYVAIADAGLKSAVLTAPLTQQVHEREELRAHPI